jgi:hypothetical protein
VFLTVAQIAAILRPDCGKLWLVILYQPSCSPPPLASPLFEGRKTKRMAARAYDA